MARLRQTLGGRSGGPLTHRSYTTTRDTTKAPPPKLAETEFIAIAEIIAAPDSRPGRMMTVKKKNSAKRWSEAADSKRARATIDEFQASFEKAAEKLASEPIS